MRQYAQREERMCTRAFQTEIGPGMFKLELALEYCKNGFYD
ncbi:hypothetical protein MIDIC_50041 [Alphaproteobacteria bacterium]